VGAKTTRGTDPVAAIPAKVADPKPSAERPATGSVPLGAKTATGSVPLVGLWYNEEINFKVRRGNSSNDYIK